MAYTVIKVSPDHYRLAEGNVFMELLLGREKAMLIDTGYGYGNLPKTIREITDLPLVIACTHGHPDHACGNWQFTESVWMNEKDLLLAQSYNTPEARQNFMPAEKPEDFMERAYLAGGMGNPAFTREGQIFDLGGLLLETVDLPGHTEGSIGILDRAGRRLFVGDAMNKAMFLFQQGVSRKLSVYMETLEKVRLLPVDVLWAGHTPKALPKNESVDLFLRCAREADFSKAFPCGTMLGTEDVRLFVTEQCRDAIDPDNLMYSIYGSGIQERADFCSIFLSQYTL